MINPIHYVPQVNLNQKYWIKIEIYYPAKLIKVLYYELLRGKKTLKFCSKNQWRSKTTDLNEWNYVYWDPLDFLKKFGVCGPTSSMWPRGPKYPILCGVVWFWYHTRLLHSLPSTYIILANLKCKDLIILISFSMWNHLASQSFIMKYPSCSALYLRS